MKLSIELNDTLAKGLTLYAQDRITDEELSDEERLQAGFEQIVSASLESYIRIKSTETNQAKTVDELAADLDV